MHSSRTEGVFPGRLGLGVKYDAFTAVDHTNKLTPCLSLELMPILDHPRLSLTTALIKTVMLAEWAAVLLHGPIFESWGSFLTVQGRLGPGGHKSTGGFHKSTS